MYYSIKKEKMDKKIENVFKLEVPETILGTIMKTILISTLYGPDPVLLACTKLSPDKLILLVTEQKDKLLDDSIDLIKKSLGRVLDIDLVKIPQYDIVKIAETVVKTIDKLNLEGQIVVNITSGRKTQSMGVLFGAYARNKHVKKIAYYPEGHEKGSVIYLPILSLKLTDSQEKILDSIKSNNIQSHKSLADRTGLSTAMIYRAIDDLMSRGLIDKTEDEGIILTDAGKIARL